MEQDLFKIFKNLKQIRPDPDYLRQSRILIIGSRKEENALMENSELKRGWLIALPDVFRSWKMSLAASTVAFLILIIFGGIYCINRLNQNNFVVKAGEINSLIQIKLDEIKYRLENSPQLELEKISVILPLLEKSVNELKEVSVSGLKNDDLENSLEKIKAVQEIFNQIDAILNQ